MGDPRRFWRETIGVVQGRGATREGGATETAGRPASQEERAREHPPGDLGQVERRLAELPAGSIGFAAAVSRVMWPDATADELAALACLAERIRAVNDGTLKRMALRAVALRQEAARAANPLPLRTADADTLEARAHELQRLARLAREAAEVLDRALAADPRDRVIAAARQIVPATGALAAEAALSAELARQARAIQGGDGTSPGLIWRPIDEADEVFAAVGRRALDPHQALFWQVYAACSLVNGALDGQEPEPRREALAGLLDLVAGRLERAIDDTIKAHARSGPLSARQAAWRRLLLDTRARLDETVSPIPPPPVGQPAPAPVAEAAVPPPDPRADRPSGPATGPVAAPADEPPSGPEVTAPPPAPQAAGPAPAVPRTEPDEPVLPPADRAIVEHFRTVRAAASPTPAPPPAVRRGLLFLVAGAGVVALLLLFARLMLPPPVPETPPVSVDELSAMAPLSAVTPAGALLIATVDPTWDRMGRDAQEIAALRLMTAAERRGFRAGLLLAADGRPVARWSPGRAPELISSGAEEDVVAQAATAERAP